MATFAPLKRQNDSSPNLQTTRGRTSQRATRKNTSVTRQFAESATFPRGEVIQAKLKIGSIHDPHEREADRVANAVMSDASLEVVSGGPEPLQVRRNCDACEHDESELQREMVANRPAQTTPVAPGPAFEHSIHRARAHGRSIDPTTRTWMESRFGVDFSRVRVHDDRSAAALAGEINARAFTVGHDIFFGAGEYRPGIAPGRRLIAHELTHVVQQGRHVMADPVEGEATVRRWTDLAASKAYTLDLNASPEEQAQQLYEAFKNAVPGSEAHKNILIQLSKLSTQAQGELIRRALELAGPLPPPAIAAETEREAKRREAIENQLVIDVGITGKKKDVDARKWAEQTNRGLNAIGSNPGGAAGYGLAKNLFKVTDKNKQIAAAEFSAAVFDAVGTGPGLELQIKGLPPHKMDEPVRSEPSTPTINKNRTEIIELFGAGSGAEAKAKGQCHPAGNCKFQADKHQEEFGGEQVGDAFGIGPRFQHVVVRLPNGKTLDTTALNNIKTMDPPTGIMNKLIAKLDTFTPEQWNFIQKKAQEYFQRQWEKQKVERADRGEINSVAEMSPEVVKNFAMSLGVTVEEFKKIFK